MPETRPRRQRRKSLSDAQVAALRADPDRVIFHPDPEMANHGVRIYPSGQKSYTVVRRDAYGKQRWVALKSTTLISIEAARKIAAAVIERLDAGKDPFPPDPVKADSVADVAYSWLKRHVEKNKLRTGEELRRIVEKHILVPAWRNRPFKDLRRSDVTKLLDAVEDENGAWVADSVLTTLRSIASWYASRNDDYAPPFTRNMRRVQAQDRKRDRALSEAEVRKVWRIAEELSDAELEARAEPQPSPVYGAQFARFIQILLLTGQRRDKVATMKWSDLASDGTWTIATEKGEKGNAKSLKLPPQALAIVKRQPKFKSNPYVFTSTRLAGHIGGFTYLKERFDERAGVSGYTLHDLRRTARTLMTDAGVSNEVAERVLGHALPGVVGTYNVSAYAAQKERALAILANHIEHIVDGDAGGNVVPFEAATS
jgi:integrase